MYQSVQEWNRFQICSSEEEKKRLLHCVVIGGGPTGVEFNGELSDFIMRDVRERYTHVKDYIQVTLIEVLICNFFPCLFINCVQMKYDFIGTGFALRTPASAYSVGGSVGTVTSAPIGWVGSGNVLLTPQCVNAVKQQ